MIAALDFVATLGTALLAAVLALAGNYLTFGLQNRAKVREERREFVRQQHSQTVDLVVDVDLFVRSIRSDAIGGADDEDATRALIEERWEGDLLRRVRHARFGHPDPDVRRAAEVIEDEMWPFITMAKHAYVEGDSAPWNYDYDKRRPIAKAMEAALAELRRSVYAAPHRDLPRNVDYDGAEIPSRFYRALVAEQEEGSAD